MAIETKQPPVKQTGHRKRQLSPISSGMRLMDMIDVVDFTRLSDRTIERMIQDGEFPKPIEVRQDKKRASHRWTLQSIEAWVRRRTEKAEESVA